MDQWRLSTVYPKLTPKDLCYPGLESELWYPALLPVLIHEIPTKIRMEEWLVSKNRLLKMIVQGNSD
jgi:hypothetical protein